MAMVSSQYHRCNITIAIVCKFNWLKHYTLNREFKVKIHIYMSNLIRNTPKKWWAHMPHLRLAIALSQLIFICLYIHNNNNANQFLIEVSSHLQLLLFF